MRIEETLLAKGAKSLNQDSVSRHVPTFNQTNTSEQCIRLGYIYIYELLQHIRYFCVCTCKSYFYLFHVDIFGCLQVGSGEKTGAHCRRFPFPIPLPLPPLAEGAVGCFIQISSRKCKCFFPFLLHPPCQRGAFSATFSQ